MTWQSKVPKENTKPEGIVRGLLEELLKGTGRTFTSQYKIQTRFREWPFIVDFIVHPLDVIEVKGRYWHSKKGRIKKDRVKEECLKAEGYRFMDIWDDELKKKNLDNVREKLSTFLSGGPPSVSC